MRYFCNTFYVWQHENNISVSFLFRKHYYNPVIKFIVKRDTKLYLILFNIILNFIILYNFNLLK